MSKKKRLPKSRKTATKASSNPAGGVGISISKLVNRALKFHGENNLTAALALYTQILAQDPKNLIALQYFGLIQHLQGNDALAIEYMQQALNLRPNYVVCAINLAKIYLSQNNLELAKKYDLQALQYEPNNVVALADLGDVYSKLLESELAHKYCIQALQVNPKYYTAMNTLGAVALANNDYQTAGDYFHESLQINSQHADTHDFLGQLFFAQEHSKTAEKHFRQAIKVNPKCGRAYANLALISFEQGDNIAAKELCQQALVVKPKLAAAYKNLALIATDAKEYTAAEKYYQQVLSLKPQYHEIHLLCANLCHKQQQYQQAETLLQQYIELNGQQVKTYLAVGIMLNAWMQINLAISYFQRALDLEPTNIPSRMNLAYAELKLGLYLEAFKNYETRILETANKYLVEQKLVAATEWHGEAMLAGQTLLVSWEQGFGDVIQFVRYLPLLQNRIMGGGRIECKLILYCQAPLVKLFASSFPEIQIIANTQPLPKFDKHVLVMSLPYLFGTSLETIPNNTPYLFPAPKLTPELNLLPEKLNVGLVWAGNKTYKNDKQRSVQLKPFLPLLELENTHFYSLQVGENSQDITKFKITDKIIDCSPMIQDFADTASIIQQLDLVLSIDSGVAHLTGALNKPVWICLPFASEWRWLENRTDSPWYPSARLFKQTQAGDWESVVSEIQQALPEFHKN